MLTLDKPGASMPAAILGLAWMAILILNVVLKIHASYFRRDFRQNSLPKIVVISQAAAAIRWTWRTYFLHRWIRDVEHWRGTLSGPTLVFISSSQWETNSDLFVIIHVCVKFANNRISAK